MEPFKTRGYGMITAVKYVKEALDPGRRAIVLERIPPETIRMMETAKPTEWYPASLSGDLLTAIAESANGDAAVAERDLVGLGKFAANEATNTFLRLLMKVLTPTLFAKKLPSLYERDNTKGKVTVDVNDQRLVCRVDDCKGYAHIGPMSMGWSIFALESMGKKLSESRLHGWSLDNPDSGSFGFELDWKA
jgi:hypothetical protein